MYVKFVKEDGTLNARSEQVPNCVTGGRLLRTDEDCERCACVLAGIDPSSFTDEFRVFFEESGARQRPQSSQLKDLLRSYAAEHLQAVRSDRSLTEVEETRLARQEAVSRRTTTHVIARKSTNDIIEEEAGKIELLAHYLQDNVDEHGEPRLVEGLVEDFKKLQALSSPVLTNALRKKASTQLSLKNWCVTDEEMASILRRRPGVDPSLLPSSTTPRVQPLSESEDDDDSLDDGRLQPILASGDLCGQRDQTLRDISEHATSERHEREAPERGAIVSFATFCER